MKILISKLHFETNSEDLREAFQGYGDVVSAKVFRDHFSGRSKGIGFVEMGTNEDGLAAIEELNGTEFHSRIIIVNPV